MIFQTNIMSAILFNLDRPQESNSESSDHQLRNAFIEPSTYTNGSDVCEELLGSKMTALELNEVAMVRLQHNCDGSVDSGVDITNSVNVRLHRALSSNSGGYASSTGAIDETTQGLNMSFDSMSMISCSSDLCEPKMGVGSVTVVGPLRTANNYECCSENGSESSSVAVPSTASAARRSNSVKKKVAMFEPGMQANGTTVARGSKDRDFSASACTTAGQLQSRLRLSTLKRTASLPRPSHALATMPTHERTSGKQTPNNGKAVAAASPLRVSSTKPQKPDSLPNALSRTQSISMQRLAQRTPSLSRARTPGTPSDDGRWPGVGNTRTAATVAANSKRGLSVTPDLASVKMRSSMMASTDGKTNNPYSTLPRRRKQKSVEDLTGRSGSRSSSITRESRMTSSVILSSRKNLVSSYGGASTPTQTKMLPPFTTAGSATGKGASMRKPLQTKTRIYHETSVQTALTGEDVERAFAGEVSAVRPVEAAEQRDQQTQSDIRDRELERLRDEVRQLAQREHDLSAKLQREREDKLTMQRELHLNTERVIGMLEMARVAGGDAGTPTSDDGGHDSLLMLESQIQISGHELIERQQEIGQLRQLCRSLQLEMQRSLTSQECLLQEKATIEQESSELQDFLQNEKAALCDALKEIELDYQECKQQLASRDEEVKVLRDECRHLVRLNEQRRQENRMLQTKYGALESKSKELIMQQNSSVSGASAALSGLHTRLDSLVEQLISSYSISELDLEDVGFQNETQTNSGTISCDGSNECENQAMKTTNGFDLPLHQQHHHHLHQLPQSSDGSLSPQRNQSFIAAVISAIRNATTPSGKRLLARSSGPKRIANQSNQPNSTNNNNNQNEPASNGDESDSTEMLDSETEPCCLMMDNVLEDVAMPDSHSHNMVSSCTGMISQIEIPSELVNVTTTGDESLHNLSQAIANRQQMELTVQKVALQLNQPDNSISEDISCYDSVAEMPSLVEYCSIQAVVDQVIEVDGLVTKLLKVLRLIQMDNDNCIQQLIVDKNKLQQNKEDMLEKLKDLQDVNVKLQDELMDATQELMLKNSDLSSTKAEMQRHRNEIDRLTEDVCNLSTLCSNYRKLSPTAEFPPNSLLSRSPTDAEAGMGILNLLKMWQEDGQLKDARVRSFLSDLFTRDDNKEENRERLRIYANQLENVLKILDACVNLQHEYPALQQLRKDIEIVKLNASWAQVADVDRSSAGREDVNANEDSATANSERALKAN